MDANLLGLIPNLTAAYRNRNQPAQAQQQHQDDAQINTPVDPPIYSQTPEHGQRHIAGVFPVHLTIRYHEPDRFGLSQVATARKVEADVGFSEATPFSDVQNAIRSVLLERGIQPTGDELISAARRRGFSLLWIRSSPEEVMVSEHNWEDVVAGLRRGEYESLQVCCV